jgi:hypothetical protein
MYKRICLILWATFLLFKAHGQELTIYVIPPHVAMDWRSPRLLLASYLDNLAAKNKYHKYRHPLGHVLVELRDTNFHTIVGVTARSRVDLTFKVIVKGYGLGIFFSKLPGRMQDEAENKKEILKRSANGDIAFIKFKLNRMAFERLKQYLEEYRSSGYGNIYNGDNTPREGTGSGCSAFGISFIELAGLLPEEVLIKWMVHKTVPEKLIGGPEGNYRWVGLYKVAARKTWADSSKHKYRSITYFEPGLMHAWILSMWNNSNNSSGFTPELMASAKGISIDCSKYNVPTDPIWLNKAIP